jgi:thioredoxin reductase
MYDLIVIGAGPAGASAALEAHHLGLAVLLIDEQADAGGQVWRNKSKSILKAPKTQAGVLGDKLRETLEKSNLETKFETRVWQIEKQEDHSWLVGIQGRNNHFRVQSKMLILATGAMERIIPVPGWTLPGVIGLAGATALFKEQMILPGQKTVVAGNGPLLFFVASEILRLGGTLSAVVSLNSRKDWLSVLPSMILKPAFLWQGIKWIINLHLNRIPIYWQYGVSEIKGTDTVESVQIRQVNDKWYLRKEPKIAIECDSVCYGHGLMPAIDATRLAGADHHFDASLGGWVPTIDQDGRTSVSNLFVCGDNAGILGVGAAPHRGRLAALAVFEDLKGPLSDDETNKCQIELHLFNKAKTFGLAATKLTIPKLGMVGFMTKSTEICRCEGVLRSEVEDEINLGSISPNAIKSGTRFGMGPCGGKFCSESLAMITEQVTGKTRVEIGLPTARPPLRPICIDELSNDLNYDDLPIPEVSPL